MFRALIQDLALYMHLKPALVCCPASVMALRVSYSIEYDSMHIFLLLLIPTVHQLSPMKNDVTRE